MGRPRSCRHSRMAGERVGVGSLSPLTSATEASDSSPYRLSVDPLWHGPGARWVHSRDASSPAAARSQTRQCYHATEATMATTTRRVATEKDLLAMPKDGQKYELVDGQIRVSPAGDRHSVVALRLGSRLLAFATQHQLGHVCGADAGFRLPGGNVRSPDASFVAAG